MELCRVVRYQWDQQRSALNTVRAKKQEDCMWTVFLYKYVVDGPASSGLLGVCSHACITCRLAVRVTIHQPQPWKRSENVLDEVFRVVGQPIGSQRRSLQAWWLDAQTHARAGRIDKCCGGDARLKKSLGVRDGTTSAMCSLGRVF